VPGHRQLRPDNAHWHHAAIERGGGYLGMLDLRDPIELFEEGWTGAAGAV
jgi:hypothetical protein